MAFGGALRFDLIWGKRNRDRGTNFGLTSIDEKRVVPCSGARWPLT